jgi:hypothetical protein
MRRFAGLVLLLVSLLGAAFAQDRLYLVPPGMVERFEGAIQIRYEGGAVSYVDGLGWLPFGPDIPPYERAGRLYLSETLLDHLPLALPRLEGIRISERDSIRIVLDISEGARREEMEVVRQEGRLDEQGLVRFELPQMLVPLDLDGRITESENVDILLDKERLNLMISGTAFVYQAFPLSGPSRLVIDLEPLRFARVEEVTRVVHDGVVYRRFAAPTATGSSGVHLVEIAPGRGHFRVVGESYLARPLSQLASGSLVAINAGYFDTASARAIGLLRVDYGTQSLPFEGRPGEAHYLGRAAIGFGYDSPTIERVRADVSLHLGGARYDLTGLQRSGQVRLSTRAGAEVGRPTQRSLVVAGGVVRENGYGPRTVPPGGFVVSYDPHIDALGALVPGSPARLETQLSPAHFNAMHYAVEAGPLLVKDGRASFLPDAESFVGDMLTKRTDRSAIGIRPDGTVLFVAADSMTAAELVPLFENLGAESAMSLDGGGSTTLYLDGEVVNRRLERPVVSAIVFIPY